MSHSLILSLAPISICFFTDSKNAKIRAYRIKTKNANGHLAKHTYNLRMTFAGKIFLKWAFRLSHSLILSLAPISICFFTDSKNAKIRAYRIKMKNANGHLAKHTYNLRMTFAGKIFLKWAFRLSHSLILSLAPISICFFTDSKNAKIRAYRIKTKNANGHLAKHTYNLRMTFAGKIFLKWAFRLSHSLILSLAPISICFFTDSKNAKIRAYRIKMKNANGHLAKHTYNLRMTFAGKIFLKWAFRLSHSLILSLAPISICFFTDSKNAKIRAYRIKMKNANGRLAKHTYNLRMTFAGKIFLKWAFRLSHSLILSLAPISICFFTDSKNAKIRAYRIKMKNANGHLAKHTYNLRMTFAGKIFLKWAFRLSHSLILSLAPISICFFTDSKNAKIRAYRIKTKNANGHLAKHTYNLRMTFAGKIFLKWAFRLSHSLILSLAPISICFFTDSKNAKIRAYRIKMKNANGRLAKHTYNLRMTFACKIFLKWAFRLSHSLILSLAPISICFSTDSKNAKIRAYRIKTKNANGHLAKHTYNLRMTFAGKIFLK